MPWEERSLMDVRLRFVQDVHRPGWSVAEVCRRYQVSRKTGYKWLERYEKAGVLFRAADRGGGAGLRGRWRRLRRAEEGGGGARFCPPLSPLRPARADPH